MLIYNNFIFRIQWGFQNRECPYFKFILILKGQKSPLYDYFFLPKIGVLSVSLFLSVDSYKDRWCLLRYHFTNHLAAMLQRRVAIIVPSRLSTIVAILKGWCSGTPGVRGESAVVQCQMGHIDHFLIIFVVQLFRWHGM